MQVYDSKAWIWGSGAEIKTHGRCVVWCVVGIIGPCVAIVVTKSFIIWTWNMVEDPSKLI